jgi:hypothetical protein
MSWESCYDHYTDELGVDYDADTDTDTDLPYYGPETDPVTHLTQKAVRMVFARMDNMIKARTGTTVYRRTFSKGGRRPIKCEIDTFIVRWDNFPDADKCCTTPPVILPPALGLPSNHDRLWDVTFGFNSDGGLIQVPWRRRTTLDAERNVEEDVMPIPEWPGLPSRCE